MQGASFCSGAGGCGVLLVDLGTGTLAPFPAGNWSDSQVAFVVAQPPVGTVYRVAIAVAGVQSAAVSFSAPVPSWNSLVGQKSSGWVGMSTLGGEVRRGRASGTAAAAASPCCSCCLLLLLLLQPFYINGILDIGEVDPTKIAIFVGPWNCSGITRTLQTGTAGSAGATYGLSGLTPPGVGVGWPIIVTIPGGQSRADASFSFSYAPPALLDLQDVNGTSVLATGIPTLGGTFFGIGAGFGTAALTPSGSSLAPSASLTPAGASVSAALGVTATATNSDSVIQLAIPVSGVNCG